MLVTSLAPDSGSQWTRVENGPLTTQHPSFGLCTNAHLHLPSQACVSMCTMYICTHKDDFKHCGNVQCNIQGEALVASKCFLASLIHLGLKHCVEVIGQTCTRKSSRQWQQECMGPCSQMLGAGGVNDTRSQPTDCGAELMAMRDLIFLVSLERSHWK